MHRTVLQALWEELNLDGFSGFLNGTEGSDVRMHLHHCSTNEIGDNLLIAFFIFLLEVEDIVLATHDCLD